MKYQVIFSIFLLVLFIFIGCSNEKKEHDRLMRIDWIRAECKNTIESYENFIYTYPDNKLADSARVQIEFIKIEKMIKEEKELEAQMYEKSEADNTIFSFQNYLDKYPEGVFTENAEKKINEIIDGRHDAYKHVKTALLRVKESSPNVKNLEMRFKELGVYYLKTAGIKTVFDGKSSEYDAILNINVNYKALSTNYSPFGEGNGIRRYSGAQVVGNISLVVPGTHSVKRFFKGIIHCPEEISGDKYETPEEALWMAMIKLGSFKTTSIKMMVDIFGANYLIAILQDVEQDFRVMGFEGYPDDIKYVRSLGEPYVEELIDALNIKDNDKRESVIWILGQIGDPRAVEPLLYPKTQMTGNWYVLTDALVKIGKPAVKPLIEKLKYEDKLMRLGWEKVLKEITGKEFGGDYNKWLIWWEQNNL